jgi:hypothetical protein
MLRERDLDFGKDTRTRREGMSKRKHFGAAMYGRLLVGCVGASLFAFAPSTATAQETGGSIFGWGPAGQTVTVKGVTSGMRRHVTIKDSGRYSISRLPLGIYTVTLEKDGKAADTRSNVDLKVGRGAEVDFACPDDKCAGHEEG